MAEHDSFIKTALANAKYRDPDKTRREVMQTISQWQGLKPVSDHFVFNNGSQKLLLALKGTVPVSYKGNTYNIPIIIWLLDTHPYNAPMVYVNPTPDMRIKVSRHVDHNGKVYLPYLHDWKHNSSEILLLIQVLIMTFQEQPPVFAVTSPPQPPVPYPTSATYSTPYPTGMSSGMPMPGMPMPMNAQMATPYVNIRPSLLTAVEEKLRNKLEVAYLSKEFAKNTGDQLKAGRRKLEMLMQRLGEEKTTLEQNIVTVQNECAALDEKIKNSKLEEEVSNIDDAIQAPAVLYKQIVTIVSEEAALEDTVYYLGDALRRERMDLEQYLRTVRQLSRRQFMQRALLRKCRQRAGFAG